MQVCISFQTDNHASTPPLKFLQAGCPSCRPTNSVKALKAHQSTEGTNSVYFVQSLFDARCSLASLKLCYLLSDRSCSGDEDRENIDRLHASSEQHKRQLRCNQLDVRKSEQKIKDLTINIRYQIYIYITACVSYTVLLRLILFVTSSFL